ncbi:hypothetical protein HK097_009176 [Rhizophlyctis rosea]|uniref:Uncharacterized protein n=1 Tax=Rhizophlyctis rosea TaxID=64517 RepID=A0AAD5SHV8_9FUNG|nr:hypothetical protein HK097_009176 [Rhizophlyctis rosea]
MAHSIALSELQSLTPTPLHPTDTDAIIQSLQSEGYAVVQVMSPETASERLFEFWDWLEGLNPALNRHYPSTWTAANWPDQIKGILKNYGIGQAGFVWKCRAEEGIRKCFAGIWGVPEDDLIVSFDGAGMYPVPDTNSIGVSAGLLGEPASATTTKEAQPTETKEAPKLVAAEKSKSRRAAKRKAASQSSTPTSTLLHQSTSLINDNVLTLWPHRDQHPTHNTLDCVQGVLHLASNLNDTDGGLILYPRSHLLNWPSLPDYSLCKPSEFFRIPPKAKHCQPSEARVIRAPAGCICLWDSRTVHCNRPPQASEGGSTRAVVYICMTPRKFASEDMLRKRVECYKKFGTGNHCPHRLSVNPVGGWMFRSGSSIDAKLVQEKLKREANPAGKDDRIVRRLVGFEA